MCPKVNVGSGKVSPSSLSYRKMLSRITLGHIKFQRYTKKVTKKEVDRLVDIDLLKHVKTSEWAASCFVIPKKDGTILFLTDFRGLNKYLKRKKHLLPLIDDIMISVEKFDYATALDLSMYYYMIGPWNVKVKLTDKENDNNFQVTSAYDD